MKKLITIITILSFTIVCGQDTAPAEKDSLHFVFEPDSLFLHIGETGEVKIKLLNQDNELSNNTFYIYGRPRRTMETKPRMSDSTGVAKVTIKAYKPGKLNLSVRSISGKREDRVMGNMVIQVPYPPLDRIVFNEAKSKVYVGTATNYSTTVFDQAELVRNDAKVELTSSDSDIADFDLYGNLKTKRSGKITVTASVDDISESVNVRVLKNPVRRLTLTADKDEIRTGDVLHFDAQALNRSGRSVDDAPVSFTYSGQANYGEFGLPAAGLVTEDGSFVAETAGIYTVIASSAGYSDQKIVRVVPRDVKQNVKLVGHGRVSNYRTSDLWVWAGVGKHEGKDFAVTGTHSADGEAYFWDVTDPANMVIIDTIKVDARTVNDVKISEDGNVGVITREGASNRKNGFVILDVSDPYNVEILSEFNDGLTGGVHNVFIYDDHVYAVNNGRKYDVINIENPKNPFRVGVYELDTPGHGVHDVWVIDGLAYSSNWADGVHVVDVGGVKQDETNRSRNQYNPFLAKAGQGGPGNPVKLGSMADRNGHNHAAFPFISQSTDNFYIITGDEWGGPNGMQGGFHFLDFTDTENPTETAVYQVPEAGSHNHWIHGDVLMASYYQGGLRIVDISGELMGDLYAQGREIAFFMSIDSEGHVPNKANVWGTMPYKDLIYFSDMNSGLWAIKLVDDNPMGTN